MWDYAFHYICEIISCPISRVSTSNSQDMDLLGNDLKHANTHHAGGKVRVLLVFYRCTGNNYTQYHPIHLGILPIWRYGGTRAHGEARWSGMPNMVRGRSIKFINRGLLRARTNNSLRETYGCIYLPYHFDHHWSLVGLQRGLFQEEEIRRGKLGRPELGIRRWQWSSEHRRPNIEGYCEVEGDGSL